MGLEEVIAPRCRIGLGPRGVENGAHRDWHDGRATRNAIQIQAAKRVKSQSALAWDVWWNERIKRRGRRVAA